MMVKSNCGVGHVVGLGMYVGPVVRVVEPEVDADAWTDAIP
jgi:hypothetical protein